MSSLKKWAPSLARSLGFWPGIGDSFRDNLVWMLFAVELALGNVKLQGLFGNIHMQNAVQMIKLVCEHRSGKVREGFLLFGMVLIKIFHCQFVRTADQTSIIKTTDTGLPIFGQTALRNNRWVD